MASKREALISSAEKSLQKGKVDLALRDYLKVLEETPNDINVLNKVGDLQVRLGKNEESITYFLRIAEHYARDGFYVRAIAMYKKINKLDPARLDIYEKLAELYVKQQLWMEAKSNYQVLADYLLKQDNLQGAIGIYQKMVAIEPQNLQLHVKLADLFTQGKRTPEALREYGVVAAALSERGAHEESIRVYEKALKLAPDNVDILKTLVPLLLSLNSVDQARAALRKGLEASPRSVPLFLLAAEAALAANDMAEARSYSDKARAVEPENEEVLAAAVRIQLKGRRPDLAWAAAAPLADAAVRKGEAKKALAILVPIARAAPDVDDLVKKIVDIASGVGDEATALPFRSALADLYRKKGKLAEAADLLRHCARVQPDNAEFRARLAQLEPAAGAATVAPPRVPATSVERHLEVTLSGFAAPSRPAEPAPQPVPKPPAAPAPPRAAAPAPAPPPKPEPEPQPATPSEFEFDLDDAEMIEAVEEPVVDEAPPPTPPHGLAVPSPEPAAADVEPAWNSLSASEALEAYEAREAEAARASLRSGAFAAPEIEELRPEAELPPADAIPRVPDLADLELALAPPEGFGEALALEAPSFPGLAAPGAGGPPEASWPSTVLQGPVSYPGEEIGGPPSFGPTSRPVSGDAALDDALVEADVFRRYGLLEKAVDQLRPWVEKAPQNLKVRERLFEIHLEQGDREEARVHAAFLAESYAATGREDRIRGLEALLGEALREAPAEAAAAEPAPPVEEPPAPGRTEEAGLADAAELVEDAGLAVAPEPMPSFGDELELAATEIEPTELPSAGMRPLVPLEHFEPPTEIISAVVPAPVPELPEAEALTPESAPVPPEPAPVPPADLDVVVEPSFDLETGVEEEVTPPAPPEPAPAPEPKAKPAPERRAAPKPELSAEELLGLGKGAPAAKKVKAVRPEDLDLDLLAGKPSKAKSKPKAAAKAEPVLPDELLKSLRAPARKADVPPPRPTPAEIRPEEKLAESSPAGAVEEVFAPAEAAGAAGVEAPIELPETPPTAAGPSAEELGELDFCLDQGMVVDAAERLQSLEGRYPGDPELSARRLRLEGGRAGADVPRAALHDILSDDLDSVLDAELGRALTEDMVRESPAAAPQPTVEAAGAPVLDESGLFSDEQEFFNFADELHTELRKETELPKAEEGEGREVSLEEIFRDFKKGVEQQLSPEDYETHYNLGIAYKEMGLTDEAIGEFQLAAKDPLHAVECCAMLGLCFLEKGLPQLSVKWYRKGLETIGIKESDRLGLLYALAGILEQVGDRDGAYRTYLDIYGTNAQYQDVAERIKALRPFVAS